ncbi:hypothetical protein DMB66_55385 [Actinoplanes sp. ATCC 53533]|uniref:hypothetical protein n=1 Tax=Actinoplanes sp. ATCC 53533 TaxID=1288362 RepID=UPI000F791E27|nr:hypothetical protein [Actinoplanes sp. ATCC 53533]RSM41952.1 hypothetical protein DMB66_55385 [Actinoplanes sp. ATCC 53533]
MGRRAAGFVLLLLCAMVLHVGLPHCGVTSAVAIELASDQSPPGDPPAGDPPAGAAPAGLLDDAADAGAYTADTVHRDDSDAVGLAVRSHQPQEGSTSGPGKVSVVLPDQAGAVSLSRAARRGRCPGAGVSGDPTLSGNLRC